MLSISANDAATADERHKPQSLFELPGMGLSHTFVTTPGLRLSGIDQIV